MTTEISNQPELRVAALRHIGPYDTIGKTFGRLGPLARPAGLDEPGMKLIAVFNDDPAAVAADKLRSDAGIIISGDKKVPAGLTEVKVPAGKYAHATHHGPYDGLPAAWTRLKEQLKGDGQKFGNGASYEVYRNTPMDTKPEDLVTDIYIPIG